MRNNFAGIKISDKMRVEPYVCLLKGNRTAWKEITPPEKIIAVLVHDLRRRQFFASTRVEISTRDKLRVDRRWINDPFYERTSP